jgi:hypothetical protein
MLGCAREDSLNDKALSPKANCAVGSAQMVHNEGRSKLRPRELEALNSRHGDTKEMTWT